jgi:endonuclease YncB( thermonuclease family)
MGRNWVIGLVVFAMSLLTAFAGDSIYGKVTAVRSGDVIVLNYGSGEYVVRIVGFIAPEAGQARAREATQFVSKMLLGKNARLRFERKAPNGEMLGRMYTDDLKGDPKGIRDVTTELLRAGLVRRAPNYNDKTGELAAAEKEAQAAQRGLWAPVRPQ